MTFFKSPISRVIFTLVYFTSLVCGGVEGIQKSPVMFEGEPVFYLSRNLAQKSAKARAENATKLLAIAIESGEGKELVKTEAKKNHFLLYVRGKFITSIFLDDAIAEGAQTLKEYSDSLEGNIESLVGAELTRQKWQKGALKFFMSVIMIVLGVFLIRQLKIGFDKLEILLVRKRSSIRKMKIFGSPIMRNESLAGVMAFTMEVLRWFAYLASGLIVFVTVLSQFQVTRNYLRELGKATIGDIVSSIQGFTLAIPGIILCLVILLALHIGIHAFNLMLDGAKLEKGKSRSIPPHRVPVLKTVVPAVFLAVFLPIAIAAFFHRYDTPAQWLVVGASLIAVLGALPVFATWLCGVIILWRDELNEGDWVLIGSAQGEIASMNTIFLHLVPLGGGTYSLPMIKVFLSNIRKLPGPPHESVDIEIKRSEELDEVVKRVEQVLGEIIEGLKLKPQSVLPESVTFKVSFPLSHAEAKDKIIDQLLHMSDSIDITLIKRS